MDYKSLSRNEVDFLVLMATEGFKETERNYLIQVCDKLIALLEHAQAISIEETKMIEDNSEFNPDEFQTFWAHFPRKVGRIEAFQAYREEIKRHAKPHEILRALKTYRQRLDSDQTIKRYRHAKQFLREWEKWLEVKA